MASQILIADGNAAWYRFDRVQRWLHWTMAALIFAAIPLGAISAYLPAGQQPRQALLEVHKSLGFTILVLLIARITWRVLAGEPRYRTPLGRLTHLASRDTIASGPVQNTPENLRKWIADPNSMKPGVLMPSMHLNDHDLDVITAYLTTLH